MKYVSTAELKAKLSHYLSEVREGQAIYVTSHHRPVAELVPIKEPACLEIIPPAKPLSDLQTIVPVTKGFLPSEDFLLEDRGKR